MTHDHVEIRFPDGAQISGRTATQVLARWRGKQWTDVTDIEFRDELAKRAYIWSEAHVDCEARPLEFLRQLSDAGLIKISIDGEAI